MVFNGHFKDSEDYDFVLISKVSGIVSKETSKNDKKLVLDVGALDYFLAGFINIIDVEGTVVDKLMKGFGEVVNVFYYDLVAIKVEDSINEI